MPFISQSADFEKLIQDALGQSEIQQELSNVDERIVERIKNIVRARSEEIWHATDAEIERYNKLETSFEEDKRSAASASPAVSTLLSFLRRFIGIGVPLAVFLIVVGSIVFGFIVGWKSPSLWLGAKVGIAIIVGCLVVFIIAYLAWRRRERDFNLARTQLINETLEI
jgi:Flp pilus assembly protein TadB